MAAYNSIERARRKIDRKVADEGNIPGSSSSLRGTLLIVIAILIGMGLIYLSTKVSASVLSGAPSHIAKTHR
jgi:hypothetical protein